MHIEWVDLQSKYYLTDIIKTSTGYFTTEKHLYKNIYTASPQFTTIRFMILQSNNSPCNL